MSSPLAAVGATRSTRRNLAAAQAGLLALLGTALGVLIGIVPGVAVSWSNSLSTWDAVQNGLPDPTIVIPWLQLAVLLIAAALAWVSIRRHPTVIHRLTDPSTSTRMGHRPQALALAKSNGCGSGGVTFWAG